MKRFRNLILFVFLGVGFMLSQVAQAQPLRSPADQDVYDVIDEINALRADHGLPAYAVSPILMTIAQSHAEHQASTGVVTHYGVSGSRPYQRALDAGYPVAGDLLTGGAFAEIVDSAKGLSVSQVVARWQEDALYRATLLSSDLEDIGFGLKIADGITYYTLDVGLADDAAVLTPFSPASTTGTRSTFQPLATNTMSENGTVYHIVQANEALWSIALAYDTTIDELKRLNRLVTDDIYEGQKLVISKREVETPTAEPSITVTLGIPTSTATFPITPSATFTSTPLPTPPASRQSGGRAVAGIVLIAATAAGLGAWLGRRKSVS